MEACSHERKGSRTRVMEEQTAKGVYSHQYKRGETVKKQAGRAGSKRKSKGNGEDGRKGGSSPGRNVSQSLGHGKDNGMKYMRSIRRGVGWGSRCAGKQRGAGEFWGSRRMAEVVVRQAPCYVDRGRTQPAKKTTAWEGKKKKKRHSTMDCPIWATDSAETGPSSRRWCVANFI